MNQNIRKIYLYPLITIVLSILPWWAFSKYVLAFDIISFMSVSANTTNRAASLFFLIFIVSIYVGWVAINMWFENAKSLVEKEKRVEKFFLIYGKSFAGLIAGHFLLILLALIII